MSSEKSEKVPFHRLPKDVHPHHYEIFLAPDLKNLTYSGKQIITVNVIKTTKRVVLNSIGLKIKTAFYQNEDKENIHFENIEYDTSQETVTIYFKKEILCGETGFLNFDFDGEINENLNGFYRTKYISDGVENIGAVTQFAPTDARRCFPCWDEPAIKATFDIHLTILEELTAISNMPIKSITKTSSNMKTVSFDRTPLMSSYLVAFIVCDYSFIENCDTSKTIRVYTPKDKIKNGEFSLEVAVKALSFYESYFNISYPLSKLDLIAVADFSFGAMENWGMITYRDVNLLVDPENTSTIRKQATALTIAHELAHQWFGNLVTMEWWTHLWLNEGYASFMEFLCIDKLYPEYNIWTNFLTSTYIRALELDALANTHPIEVIVENPSEITEIFDEISYNKGASVIRMIHDYIGDIDFQKGMHSYLEQHAYSNVQTNDLWNALGKDSNKQITEIMSSWTTLPGFPLVSVIEKDSVDSNNRLFTFSQERFFVNGTIDKSNISWMIPITLTSGLNSKKILKVFILDDKRKTVEIENIPKTSWIKINVGSVGFYRTLYSDDLFKMLLPAIQEQSLSASDRLGLLDDLFAVVQAGRVSTVKFLKLLKEFKNETDYIVWFCIINNLKKINNIILKLEDTNIKFKSFGRNLLTDIYSKLGWAPKVNESHLDTLLRSLILSQLVDFDDKIIIKECQQLFEKYKKKQSNIPPDFRGFVYRAVLSNGNSETYKEMLTLYKDTNMSEEKNRILSSLGAIADVNSLLKVLDFSISEDVRPQYTSYVLTSVTKSYQGQLLVWQFFKANWERFLNRCQGGTLLKNIVKLVIENVTEEDVLQDMEEFFIKHELPGTERTVQQSIETVKLNIAWINRDKDSIADFLKSQ